MHGPCQSRSLERESLGDDHRTTQDQNSEWKWFLFFWEKKNIEKTEKVLIFGSGGAVGAKTGNLQKPVGLCKNLSLAA